MKEYDLAIEDRTKAIQLDLEDAALYGQRAETYEAKKEYDLALKDRNEVIRLNPDDAWSYVSHANTYSLMEEYDLALTITPSPFDSNLIWDSHLIGVPAPTIPWVGLNSQSRIELRPYNFILKMRAYTVDVRTFMKR